MGNNYQQSYAEENNDKTKQKFRLGLGTFKIIHNGETIHFIHAVHGKPQGLSCLRYFTTLVLLISGSKKEILSSFVDEVVLWGSDTDTKSINVYSWDIVQRNLLGFSTTLDNFIFTNLYTRFGV